MNLCFNIENIKYDITLNMNYNQDDRKFNIDCYVYVVRNLYDTNLYHYIGKYDHWYNKLIITHHGFDDNKTELYCPFGKYFTTCLFQNYVLPNLIKNNMFDDVHKYNNLDDDIVI